jgi:hypothetical protein
MKANPQFVRTVAQRGPRLTAASGNVAGRTTTR